MEGDIKWEQEQTERAGEDYKKSSATAVPLCPSSSAWDRYDEPSPTRFLPAK